ASPLEFRRRTRCVNRVAETGDVEAAQVRRPCGFDTQSAAQNFPCKRNFVLSDSLNPQSNLISTCCVSGRSFALYFSLNLTRSVQVVLSFSADLAIAITSG